MTAAGQGEGGDRPTHDQTEERYQNGHGRMTENVPDNGRILLKRIELEIFINLISLMVRPFNVPVHYRFTRHRWTV